MKKETAVLIITSQPRRRCPRGHLLRTDRGLNVKACETCRSLAKYYHDRVELGVSARDANRTNTDVGRKNRRKVSQRRIDKWGHPGKNLYDREMRNIGKHLGLNNKAEVEEWLTKNPTPHFAGDL